MKIAYITSGTGGAFYCENCIRDYAIISGLSAIGHEVVTVPLYLPVRNDAENVSDVPVFFGAVRLYLTHRLPFLKKVPHSWLRVLDHEKILDFAASMASSTRARGNEQMTVEIIRGESGAFAEEFDKLTDWLCAMSPDVVFISNAFLTGIASTIKIKRNIPVVCMFQDEHTWVDASIPAYQKKIWDTVAEKCRSIDIGLTHSSWYAEKIMGILNISSDRISIIPFGVDPGRYTASIPADHKVSVGFLGRICECLGVQRLALAYCSLIKKQQGQKPDLSFCGGFTRDDLPVIRKCHSIVSQADGQLTIHSDFSMKSRAAYLSSLSVFSVPAYEKITLTSVMEAMAAGVPLVQHQNSIFSDIIRETGAGMVYAADSTDALADAMSEVINNKEMRVRMSSAGRDAIINKYNNVQMAREALNFMR